MHTKSFVVVLTMVYTRTYTIEAASGSGGSIEVSISVSGPRGQRKMGPAKRRGVAWPGLVWRACCAMQLDAAYTLFMFRSDL